MQNSRLQNLTHVEYQLIHMKKRNIIINVYRPPDCPIEKFSSPLNELRTKLLEIGNPMLNIISTGDLNFPTIDWQMETADGGTHENQVQANAFFAICTGTMLTAIYRGANKKITYSMSFSLTMTNLPDK